MSETFNVTIDELLKEDEEKFDISKINILEVLREQKEMRTKMAEKLLEACLFFLYCNFVVVGFMCVESEK